MDETPHRLAEPAREDKHAFQAVEIARSCKRKRRDQEDSLIRSAGGQASMSGEEDKFPRSLPALDDDNQAFWTGGANGELLINRCGECGYYIHPPTSFCPSCESRDVTPQPVSGKAEIVSMTVNHRQWFPNLQVPYVVALVAIEEQDDVRLVTNIVDCDPLSVRIGDKVKVQFEQAEDLWIPLFSPDREDT